MNLSEIGPMRGIAAFGFALAVVGPFLSWIRVGPTSTPGFETDAGLTALVLGPVGIGLALFGRRLPAKLLAVAAAVVVFALAMGDVNWVADSRETTGFDYRLGGGLILAAAGSFVAGLASLLAPLGKRSELDGVLGRHSRLQ
jgi:hypothetical protein